MLYNNNDIIYNSNPSLFNLKILGNMDRMGLLIGMFVLYLIIIISQVLISYNLKYLMKEDGIFAKHDGIVRLFVSPICEWTYNCERNEGKLEHASDTRSDVVKASSIDNIEIEKCNSDIAYDSEYLISRTRVSPLKNMYPLSYGMMAHCLDQSKYILVRMVLPLLFILIFIPLIIKKVVDKRNGGRYFDDYRMIHGICVVLCIYEFVLFFISFVITSRVLFVLYWMSFLILLSMPLSLSGAFKFVVLSIVSLTVMSVMIFDTVSIFLYKMDKHLMIFNIASFIAFIIVVPFCFTDKFHLFSFESIPQSKTLKIDRNRKFIFNDGYLSYDCDDCNFLVDYNDNILFESLSSKSRNIGTFKDGIMYIDKSINGLFYDIYYDNDNSINFINVRIDGVEIGNIRSLIIL